MSTKSNTKKKVMIAALTKSLGIVTTACKSAGFDRTQHYRWLKDDPEYKKAVDDIAEISIDFAESKLFDKIAKGDTIATIFYLKTKAKRRGYVERQEVEHSGEITTKVSGPIPVVIETPEQLAKLNEHIQKDIDFIIDD